MVPRLVVIILKPGLMSCPLCTQQMGVSSGRRCLVLILIMELPYCRFHQNVSEMSHNTRNIGFGDGMKILTQ